MNLSTIIPSADVLVQQCLNGEASAYRALYDRYSKAMYNTALRILNRTDDAEDILQEAFTDAFQQLRSFEGRSTFGAWLRQIVVYKSIAHLKKQKLYFNLDGNFTMYQQTTTFANQRNVFLINAAVRKTFGKTEAFELKVSVNDLLNQNLGIRRSINSNFISENTFQNIRRFGLLTFIWNFTKNGTPSNF